MKNEEIIETIKKEMYKVLEKYLPEVTADMLYDYGTIFYMNGNDGTNFDWEMNGRTCEFNMFYADEMGAIKAYIENDGTFDGYYFTKDNIWCGNEFEIKDFISEEEAKEFKDYLYVKRDLLNIFDEKI